MPKDLTNRTVEVQAKEEKEKKEIESMTARKDDEPKKAAEEAKPACKAPSLYKQGEKPNQ